jgi:hypothetical protein
MPRQHRLPYFVAGAGQVYQLQPAKNAFQAEEDLQAFLFRHHQALPIGEIESSFEPLVPLCREMNTPVGPIDLAFINPDGLLTLVECKLWRNPEARRQVVGQILDYATQISRWTYQDLQRAVDEARGADRKSLYAIVAEHTDRDDFVDVTPAQAGVQSLPKSAGFRLSPE